MKTTRSTRLSTLMLACLATCAGGTAQAVNFPSVPLESGVLYPPPNVRFILDDSGSMNLIAMPAELEDPTDTSGNGATRALDPLRVTDASHVHNSIHYNPATTYLPWMTASGSRLAAANYNSASRDTSTLGSAYDLRTTTQTFFVPKTPPTTSTNATDYWRWMIIGNDAPSAQRGKVYKTQYANPPAGYPIDNRDSNSGMQALTNIAVPANTAQMVVSLSGGTHGDNNNATNEDGDGADLYLRNSAAPTTSNYDYRSTGDDNDETISVMFPASGTWRAGISASSRYRNVVATVTFYTTVAEELPNASRTTVALEKQNYANWYAYHRSRMKVAKAGASEAFSSLDLNLRIGYDSINRGTGVPFDIPVDNDDGLFRDENKEEWYERLHAEDADGSTYLHRALQRAGNYFSDTESASSPYRTSSNDDILACRQNFAILTTDGYWNSTSGYTDVGDADGTAGPDTHSGPDDPDFIYEVERPYQDNLALSAARRADTLADVAMHYWKTDLAPDYDNTVPSSTDDPAFWQHMVTFGVSIGLEGTLDPATDVGLIEIGSKEWPDTRPDSPSSVNATRIDDLLHASVNGRGDFVVASNTSEFANALTGAFALLDSRTGAGSNVSTNSTSTQNERYVFQASYDTGRWNGTLKAFAVENGSVADEATWVATTPAYGSRHLFTWDTDEDEGAAFPTDAQVTALDRSARAAGPVSGADNAAYLAGDRSGESEGLRRRDSTIGDIANSSPFYDAHTEAIYVGSNDGMLHAFDEHTGVEIMAYVPSQIDFDDLGELSSPIYEHRYFVDGPMVVTNFAQTPNQNILIGSLGRGGKSLFALDVTDVRSFDGNDVMWEIVDADLGNVLGEPLITKTQDGTPVAIVGNGLNSGSGEAVLFVINLSSGAYTKIRTGEAGDNGLFAPRGWDDDNDRLVDRVFAADYRGNVWKFDFTGSTPALALGGEPMFSTPAGQPLSSGLALAKNQETGKLFVFFGSGSYFTTDDSQDETIQSLYAVIDNNETVARNELQERDIEVVAVVGSFPVRAFEAANTLPAAAKGWYIDFDTPTPGERVITRPFVLNDALIFATRIPPFDQEDACSPGGSGYINGIDAFNGTSFTASAIAGQIHDGRTIPGSVGGLPIGSVDLGINMPTQPTIIDGVLVVGGSEGELGWIRLPPSTGTLGESRSSWREIEGN